MGDGLRTVRLVSGDESLSASIKAAASGLAGFEFAWVKQHGDLLTKPPVAGDVLLLD